MEDLSLSKTEQERLMALRDYRVLDTIPEEELDDLTRLARIVCNTPIALISLIDENRVWFKSTVGLNMTQVPREDSFCRYTLFSREIYQVPDATKNELHQNNPFVTGYPHIRFYAGSPLVNPNGFILGTLCVISDQPQELDEKQKETLQLLSKLIIQHFEIRRKKAEIQQSLGIFHKMVEEVADIIYTCDHNGNFTFINQKAQHMLGYKPSELIGRNFLEVIPIEWKEQVREFYAEQFRLLKPETKLEFPVLDKWGKARWVEQSLAMLIENKRVQGFQAIVRDITERKKYEAELLETKTMLTQAMNIGRMGLFKYELATQTTQWSKEVLEMMEMPVDNPYISLEKYLTMIHPDDLAGVIHTIEKTIALQKTDTHANRMITGSGNIKWIESRVVPIFDVRGNLVFFHGTMQDITDQKALENLLISAKNAAEESMRAKDQFLANMSHEIRTPMNAIMGFADLLGDTPMDHEQAEYVSAIQTSGQNLLAIINDILDYSTIEAGSMTMEESPFSVRSVFSSLAVLFGHRAKEKNLGLLFSSDPAIPETLLGDSARLTQIITNLVSNAIKFTSKGSVKVVSQLKEKTHETVDITFAVKDTGIGIAPDKLATIFERFNQASNLHNRQFGGTGLGLSIVKKLVELQGGKVWVASEEEKGSVFEFTLRFRYNADGTNAELLEQQKVESKKTPGEIRVLLVEDNLMNQKLAERILHNMGYQVEIAENGKIAVDKIQEKEYDLVLMDMQMPEMDGYEAATIIRKKLNNPIPIIAMTAYAMIGEKEKCLSMGMNDYLAKPFRPDHLQKKIQALIGHVKTPARQKNVLNLEQLKQISGGDSSFVGSMLKVFIEDTPPELENLRIGIEKEDYALIGTMAHKLVSSIGLMGLRDRLLHVLYEIEDLCMAKENLDRIKALYEDLNGVCQQAFIEAKTHLESETGS